MSTKKDETKDYSTTMPSWLDTGGVKGSNSSSGGTSSKNKGYTKPNLGATWDANTDYQAIINEASNNGDYVTAAAAEQLRNQKILATGANYDTTNLYSGWLDNVDYGTIGKNQMANGASWEEVLDTYNRRYNKAANTVGLEQYSNDELQNMMLQYVNQQKAIEQYQNMMNDYERENPKPTEPESDPRIDKLLNEILNREDFSYDPMDDPLYKQYKEAYLREGDRAMRNTLAEAAAGAGGMNTYAITAAQQAQNNYIAQLNDKIPELYQLAYQMYINDKESKVQDLGILQDMDATQYNRYRDTINDYYKDKDFAYGAYYDGVQQGNWQTQFDNNNYWNQTTFDNDNYWKGQELELKKDEIAYNRDKYDEETAYNRDVYDKESAQQKVQYLIELGVMPDIKDIELAEWSVDEVRAAVSSVQAALAKKNKSSGGNNPFDGDGNNDGNGDDTPLTNDDGTTNYSVIQDNALNLIDVQQRASALKRTNGTKTAREYVAEQRDAGVISSGEYYLILRELGLVIG